MEADEGGSLLWLLGMEMGFDNDDTVQSIRVGNRNFLVKYPRTA